MLNSVEHEKSFKTSGQGKPLNEEIEVTDKTVPKVADRSESILFSQICLSTYIAT